MSSSSSRLPPPTSRSVPSSPKKPKPAPLSTYGDPSAAPVVRAKVTPLAMRSRPPSTSIASPISLSGRATPTLRSSQSVKNLRSPSPIKTTAMARPPSRAASAAPSTPTSLRRVHSGAPAIRTRSISTMSSTSTPRAKVSPTPPARTPSPTKSRTPLSVREQIALKRAEARKALSKTGTPSRTDAFEGLEDASPVGFGTIQEENIDLGRWSVKETIERARSTGALNLASRSLPCLPSALFEIHLGIKPEPLKLLPVEPPITTSSSDDPSSSRRRAENHSGPSWYEAQDLEILKAWSNEIVEIQPEISMFGSLKTIDLRNNQLEGLPDSFADLTALSSLDLSHNHLKSLPHNFWALPSLAILNLSHNSLSALPFNSPFEEGTNPLDRTSDPRGEWYSETITRATKPLPKLTSLDVSHNIIPASAIPHDVNHYPALLNKLDLSFNPLGNCIPFFRALSKLVTLQELKFEHAAIADDSFPVSLFTDDESTSSSTRRFPLLTILDLGETHASRPVIESVFLPPYIKQTLDFDVTSDPPKDGTIRIVVGRRIVKEPWEIEAERRAKIKAERHLAVIKAEEDAVSSLDGFRSSSPSKSRTHSRTFSSSQRKVTDKQRPPVIKEEWEIEADKKLNTEGAKRRARAAAAMAELGPSSSASGSSNRSKSPTKSTTTMKITAKPTVQKEAWEIEAEQGLLTAGGRRRARALAAMQATSSPLSPSESSRSPLSTPATSPSPPHSMSVLSNPKYYDTNSRTLTLPSSVAVTAHGRSYSLVSKAQPLSRSLSALPSSNSGAGNGNADLALAVPTPTLPLYAILSQAFSHTLRTLILSNRKMDTSFALPLDGEGPFLPCLEELGLEGCNLGEDVAVTRIQEGSDGTKGGEKEKTKEKLLEIIPRLFPSLRSLDLSYNSLTSTAFTKDTLSALILASDSTKSKKEGLRHLRLRGNRLTDLDAFQEMAVGFKGFRENKEWKLEELDLRDNEIGRLGYELGLLPLDVFLVDGNVFRIPPRRVWEREGTKGLLSWLRGRLE